MVDFLFVFTELFSLTVTVPELLGEMCTAGLFFHSGVDLFAFKFYLDRVAPINHSWHQKTRDTGLLDCEDCILLHSLVLTQYQSVTDGRLCCGIYSACKASLAVCCINRNI